MDNNSIKSQSMVVEEIMESLIKFEVIEEDEVVSGSNSIITVDNLWSLFLKAQTQFEEITLSQSKEMEEVQNYVDHVRSLSEERDHLTEEFDRENEKLKRELKDITFKTESELIEVQDMCKQENLDELIGSSFSEQMAYLLVVRATLLDKVEVLQEQLDESNHKHSKLSQQIHELTSEDGELRGRMNSAMSEMGGMAAKLTEALHQRDNLQAKVEELTAALEGIKNLPELKEAENQNINHRKLLDEQKEYYSAEMDRLRTEIEEINHISDNKELELNVHIEEIEEMNTHLQKVNLQLNNQLNADDKKSNSQDRKRVLSDSQKIIEEMQAALVEDEDKVEEMKSKHKQEIKVLEGRIEYLQNHQDDKSTYSDANFNEQEQMKRAKQLFDRQETEMADIKEKLKSAKMEIAVHEATRSSIESSLKTQEEICDDLKSRNFNLENELTKVWEQLKGSLEKLDEANRQKDDLTLQLKDLESNNSVANQEYSGELLHKFSELEGQIKKQNENENKITSLQFQLGVHVEKAEEEKLKRAKAEESLEEAEKKLNKLLGVEQELRSTVDDLRKRTWDAESHLLLVTGERDNEKSELMLAELSRDQLEEAINLLKQRFEVCSQQVRSYSDRYKCLKQKHRSKIRRIKELFLLERKTTADEVEMMERKCVSAEMALKKELSWKENAMGDIKRAEQDRRNAINVADTAHRKMEESNEKITQLTTLNEDLDSNKGALETQLYQLELQKNELETILRNIQKKEHKEELNTLLSSLNLSGSFQYYGSNNDSDHFQNKSEVDALLTRPNSVSYLNLSQPSPDTLKA